MLTNLLRKAARRLPGAIHVREAGANGVVLSVESYITHISFKDKNSQTPSNKPNPSAIGASMSVKKYSAIKFVVVESFGQANSNLSPDPTQHHDKGYPTNSFQNPDSLYSTRNWPLFGRSTFSSIEIELLKHYNCHIAPWVSKPNSSGEAVFLTLVFLSFQLDVYDQSRTFGHDVTRLAMNSPCVLETLLQLAAVSSGRPLDTVARRGAAVFHLQAMSNPPGAESPAAALRMLAGFVLARTMVFIDQIPNTWERSFHGDGAFRYFSSFTFLDAIHRRMWLAYLTLILRIEAAYCLMNQEAPVWIPQLARQTENQSKADDNDAESDRILHASIRCLKLLVDVMSNFLPASKVDDSTAATGDSTAIDAVAACVEKGWAELMGQLRRWHRNRLGSLKPLLEIDATEDAFPTVLFTDGAGISSNILYHTAMLLLLSNEPQPAAFEELSVNVDADVAEMSPDWHALRVCGIAVNAEPGTTSCWDLVMIAAFTLAARRITRRSQQDEILACLNRLKVSGWHVDGLIDRMRADWALVGS
ncbi:hypothetical protein F4777DRAFT_576147 [Nemania sp. FL0916]|nr:hypothetical protein F4777DRAFT_576147 [Nemania sp. FL0916]